MGRQTSIEVRELILKDYKDGKSQRKIVEMVKLSQETIQHITERYVRENRIAKLFKEIDGIHAETH